MKMNQDIDWLMRKAELEEDSWQSVVAEEFIADILPPWQEPPSVKPAVIEVSKTREARQLEKARREKKQAALDLAAVEWRKKEIKAKRARLSRIARELLAGQRKRRKSRLESRQGVLPSKVLYIKPPKRRVSPDCNPIAIEISQEFFTQLRERLLAERRGRDAVEDYLLNMDGICLIPEPREALEWVTTGGAAKLMKVCRGTIIRWANGGTIKPRHDVSPNGGQYFSVKELRALSLKSGFGEFPIRRPQKSPESRKEGL